MNVDLLYLPTTVSSRDVTKELSKVLHSPEFHRIDNGRLFNFKVILNLNEKMGVRNNGTGMVQLPTKEIGNKFYNWAKATPIRIQGKKIRVGRIRDLAPEDAWALQRTPFIDPALDDEYEDKCRQLQGQIRVDAVQFGVLHYPSYPTSSPNSPAALREYSVEWESECTAWLTFEYAYKAIHITLGDEMKESICKSITLSFSNINKLAVGYDGMPYICFDTFTPPVFETFGFHRSLTGDEKRDRKRYKHRISSLDPRHALVAQYAHKLRLLLYPAPGIVERFVELCGIAGISPSRIVRFMPPSHLRMEASRRCFFEQKKVWRLRKQIVEFSWPVAFQLELLLHNCLLHTEDLDHLIPLVKETCLRRPSKDDVLTGNLLRSYSEALSNRSPRESPRACFLRVRQHFTFKQQKLSAGYFLCCHITVAPTRMILEGPYHTQSNRIIRRYPGFEDHFIRVEFRDENRLPYRWNQAVDITPFLLERIGGILREGFELAGRKFEFLAYSSSALKEHSVWFINPFEYQHPNTKQMAWITADSIRNTIGDFKSKPIMTMPSKWAARLGQAFTSTNPSVTIRRDQWTVVEDLGLKPYLHTDGAGTISESLGDEIWERLCEGRRDHGENMIKPSAYQIRFLGYKGVVAVDPRLDDNPIRMRLRPSMGKFENSQATEANIEIASYFNKPMRSYLNRQLVVILEDKLVRREVFQELQDDAVAKALTINDSMQQFSNILEEHSLGNVYRLSYIISRLSALRLDIATPGIDTPFLKELREVGKIHVLQDIKYRARILVPDSYQLIGVPDEGPAYVKAGCKNVFTLKKRNIYACIQRPGEKPEWFEGGCTVYRNPLTHPGDVQQVIAVKPPENMFCAFAHLRNVMVFPTVGDRSFPSMLGGGDLDGDTFIIIPNVNLQPSRVDPPASYPPGEEYRARHDDGSLRECDVDDIIKFVVEYIEFDVLGVLSGRLIRIAGIYHKDCETLAALCSQAVDYPKQGVRVELRGAPDRPKKPDWQAGEAIDPRVTDYYESQRALGFMYRSISWKNPEKRPAYTADSDSPSLSTDALSLKLTPSIEQHLFPYTPPDGSSHEITTLFHQYADELRYICTTQALANTKISEAEVVVGTMLGAQDKARRDRIWRMIDQASQAVRDVRQGLLPYEEEKIVTKEMFRAGLKRAWCAWDFSLRHSREFGALSFGLVALRQVFECLEGLDGDGHMIPTESYEP
ncbi:RNA dependent RNA polymerase-domain-containing protein [Desarmillaria tabescens]|uniref:RNA-dependent RNA polymerase n=1 Tax=Armillaria tabescens TaxID=1929756 RepID=A0AA39JT92_ARMTA|nr:RNA dependent RNA polymerase-domain-containing protein [Desarmillaria tabescens]KAK0447465.1 RNA dependent RNA polymerase-domain-containing protein [Desarmillaria tabescens]